MLRQHSPEVSEEGVGRMCDGYECIHIPVPVPIPWNTASECMGVPRWCISPPCLSALPVQYACPEVEFFWRVQQVMKSSSHTLRVQILDRESERTLMNIHNILAAHLHDYMYVIMHNKYLRITYMYSVCMLI